MIATHSMGFPTLSLIIFLPTLGAIVLLFFKEHQTEAIKKFALLISVITFLLSLKLLINFDSDTHLFQFVEKVSWIESFGISYFVGVDGISILLILLTTLITAIVILASWTDIKNKVKAYMILFLVLETSVLGVFMSLDLFLFYVFWEVMLIPMVFIIGVWGGERRVYASMKFFIFTFLGSVFMLLGILTIYFYHGKATGNYTFDVTVLYDTKIPAEYQFWIFLSFLLGLAVKVPMFPLHTWLSDAHTEAPTGGSVILAGLLLKLGPYGFFRFGVPLLPEASISFAPLMIFLSIVAIVYGAWVAIAQKDMKKLIAYSSVSHMGFITLGLFVFNQEGWEGSILQMINHGISTSGLFLLIGIIYERTHDRMIGSYTGLFSKMPVYAVFFLIIMLSSMGLPVTNGFIGELYILMGAFQSSWMVALLAVTGILFGAVYLLWLFQRIFLGKFKCKVENLKDLNARECAVFAPLLILIFWIGLYPKPFLKTMSSSVTFFLEKVETKEMIAVSRDNNKLISVRSGAQTISFDRAEEKI